MLRVSRNNHNNTLKQKEKRNYTDGGKLNVRSDQSSLSFRVGHCQVQLTAVDMYNFTTWKNKKISKVQKWTIINHI